jgi:muramoyltetrapeptide carboxypeptidase
MDFLRPRAPPLKGGAVTIENGVRIPGRIGPGSRIGIVAPSGAVPRDRFEQGVAVIESMGFSTRMHGDVFGSHRYLAGTDRRRADALHRCFTDNAVDAVICARGGYGALRLLPYLEPALIRRHPKPFIGFSDISALLWTFYRYCGLATFHGPVVTSLAGDDPSTRDALARVLCSGRSVHLKGAAVITEGKAEGPVVGGNLSTLSHLLGTPFAPRFGGCILMLEDTNEPTYKIDRMLTQMKLAGCFEDLSGLVLGTFTDCGPMEAIFEVVAELFDASEIPIMAGVDVGHGTVNLTMPIGMRAVLDTAARRLVYDRGGRAGTEGGFA